MVVTSEGSKWNAAAMKSFAPSTIDSWYSKNQWRGPPRAAAHSVLSKLLEAHAILRWMGSAGQSQEFLSSDAQQLRSRTSNAAR